MLYYTGQYEKAKEQYELVTQLTPDNHMGFSDLGIIQDHFNLVDEAVASFQKSIALFPNPLAYRNLGDLHFRHRQYDKAVEALEAACALNKDDWISWGWLGHARYWAGDIDGARDAWGRVIELGIALLEINPKNDDVLILMTEAYTARGDTERGFALLQRLLALTERRSFNSVLYRPAV